MKDFEPINLLIVDDNSLMVDAIRRMMKTLNNINVVGDCADGSEVLPFLQNNKIDIIFLDIIMKKVDGFKTIERVKKYNSKIKIIGFSLISHTHFINSLMDMGADGFIPKYEADKESISAELERVIRL